AEEVHHGGRVLEYPGVLVGDAHQQLPDLVEIRPIGHPDPHDDPGDGVRQRPVDQLVGDEHLVGDDDFLAVEIGDGGGADADAAHGAGQVADGHHVADAG